MRKQSSAVLLFKSLVSKLEGNDSKGRKGGDYVITLIYGMLTSLVTGIWP